MWLDDAPRCSEFSSASSSPSQFLVDDQDSQKSNQSIPTNSVKDDKEKVLNDKGILYLLAISPLYFSNSEFTL